MESKIDSSSSLPKTLSLHGHDCVVHVWNDGGVDIKGVAVIYHGFLAHGKYPTVRYAAELLAASKYVVLAVDLPGHGRSPGMRGYLPSADSLVEDGVEIAKYAQEQYGLGVPLFLIGSSMGGTLALAASQNLPQEVVAGVVLLAPMLALSVSEPARYILKFLSYVVPRVPLIPSSASSSEKQYRDASKRKECDDDDLTVSGSKLRVASAATCVDLTKQTSARFANVKVPIICMIANEDVVVDNDGALELMDSSPSTDKTLKRYDALHGLLCEPPPLIDQIHSDLLSWINEHSTLWYEKHRAKMSS